jgi:uncharacterized protein (DUF58 family)
MTESYDGTHGQRAQSGIEPQEVREYAPGDKIENIDWNATARQNDLHIRQYGAGRDRRGVIVVDQSASMNTGRPGETKYAYACEAILVVIERKWRDLDSLALYTVADDTIVTRHQSPASEQSLLRLRGPLLTQGPGDTLGARATYRSPVSPLRRQRLAHRLRRRSTVFDETLSRYFSSQPVVETDETNPFRAAIQREQTRTEEALEVTIVTDDADPDRVWESVQFARQTDTQVQVFLTPHVLFESGGLDDLERAYGRYREFERFRQSLDALPGVSAFEVGPGDRFRTVFRKA